MSLVLKTRQGAVRRGSFLNSRAHHGGQVRVRPKISFGIFDFWEGFVYIRETPRCLQRWGITNSTVEQRLKTQSVIFLVGLAHLTLKQHFRHLGFTDLDANQKAKFASQ